MGRIKRPSRKWLPVQPRGLTRGTHILPSLLVVVAASRRRTRSNLATQ